MMVGRSDGRTMVGRWSDDRMIGWSDDDRMVRSSSHHPIIRSSDHTRPSDHPPTIRSEVLNRGGYCEDNAPRRLLRRQCWDLKCSTEAATAKTMLGSLHTPHSTLSLRTPLCHSALRTPHSQSAFRTLTSHSTLCTPHSALGPLRTMVG